MKKAITCIIIFILVGKIAFSQNNDFLAYNKIINQAELAIVDSLYVDALKQYEMAFKMLEIPKAKDLHNAALCSMYSGNFDKTFQYFDLLIDKGVTKEYFENETFDILKQDNGYQIFMNSFEEKHQHALSRKDLKLLSEIKQMYKNDQEIAHLKNYDQAKYSGFIDTVVFNIIRFQEIVKEYGFPDEDMLGIEKPYSSLPIWVMLFHFYQLEDLNRLLQDSAIFNNPQWKTKRHIVDIDFSKFNVLEINKNAILEGKFSPYTFVHYQDEILGTQYGSLTMIQVDKHVGIIRHTGDNEEQINANRKEIGLESLKDFYKKVAFYQKITGQTPIGEDETIEEYRERIKSANSDKREKFYFDISGCFQSYDFISKKGGDQFFQKLMKMYSE